jgi:hypothetical protein
VDIVYQDGCGDMARGRRLWIECHSFVAISSRCRMLDGEELVDIIPNDSRGKVIPTMAVEGLNPI